MDSPQLASVRTVNLVAYFEADTPRDFVHHLVSVRRDDRCGCGTHLLLASDCQSGGCMASLDGRKQRAALSMALLGVPLFKLFLTLRELGPIPYSVETAISFSSSRSTGVVEASTVKSAVRVAALAA